MTETVRPPFPSTGVEIPLARPPALVSEGWRRRWPWLVQGTTTRGDDDVPYDLGLFGGGDHREVVVTRWAEMASALAMDGVVHARQVHGSRVGVVERHVRGLTIPGDRDGHATDRPGVLLGVTIADCVPVFVVDPVRRAVAALHAGWRGAAAGILEEGIETMRSAFSSEPPTLFVHLGPAICGACYEVGPEVFEAMGRPRPRAPTPIDLRALLAERAAESGVPRDQITVSAHCTRCTDSGLLSHRGGDPERQVGFIGIRRG